MPIPYGRQTIEDDDVAALAAVLRGDWLTTGPEVAEFELRALADRHDLALVADACHALGATYRGRPVGALADLSTFSFHPVKPITTAEGGAVTTNDADRARHMRSFRNHGITTDHRQREAA